MILSEEKFVFSLRILNAVYFEENLEMFTDLQNSKFWTYGVPSRQHLNDVLHIRARNSPRSCKINVWNVKMNHRESVFYSVNAETLLNQKHRWQFPFYLRKVINRHGMPECLLIASVLRSMQQRRATSVKNIFREFFICFRWRSLSSRLFRERWTLSNFHYERKQQKRRAKRFRERIKYVSASRSRYALHLRCKNKKKKCRHQVKLQRETRSD